MFTMDYREAHIWMASNYHIPIYAIIFYVLHIFYAKSLMEKREKALWFVKRVKFVWDLILGISSGIGAYYLVPQLLSEISTKGLNGEICTSTIQSTNFVLYYFMLSKFFELFDTTLIVLGKNKLIFLHWYHHIATLMYCWDGYVVQNQGGAIFTGMNLCVHTFMYLYYAATFFGRLPNYLRAVITSLQLIQMVIGTYVTIAHLNCLDITDSQRVNSMWAMGMYISYFILFAKLFVDQYIIKKPLKDEISSAPKKSKLN